MKNVINSTAKNIMADRLRFFCTQYICYPFFLFISCYFATFLNKAKSPVTRKKLMAQAPSKVVIF